MFVSTSGSRAGIIVRACWTIEHYLKTNSVGTLWSKIESPIFHPSITLTFRSRAHSMMTAVGDGDGAGDFDELENDRKNRNRHRLRASSTVPDVRAHPWRTLRTAGNRKSIKFDATSLKSCSSQTSSVLFESRVWLARVVIKDHPHRIASPALLTSSSPCNTRKLIWCAMLLLLQCLCGAEKFAWCVCRRRWPSWTPRITRICWNLEEKTRSSSHQ